MIARESIKREKDLGGYVLRETVIYDDGIRMMPVDEEDISSALVPVQYDPSTKISVELYKDGYRLAGFRQSFEEVVDWFNDDSSEFFAEIFE